MEITDCMRALTSFSGYDGYVIGKIIVKQESFGQQDIIDENNDNTKLDSACKPSAIIKKQKEDYAVLYTEQRCDTMRGTMHITMYRSVTMHLMKPKGMALGLREKTGEQNKQDNQNNQDNQSKGNVVKQMIFTQKEVDEFTTLVHDTNSIHHGKNAIVPGMQMVKTLLQSVEEHEVFQLRLKFKAPMLVGQELAVICVDQQDDKRHLIVQDMEYKTTLIEGDMICEKYIL